jgi:hypothetical protein
MRDDLAQFKPPGDQPGGFLSAESKFDDSLEVLVKRVVSGNAAAQAVQKININLIVQKIGTHTSTYRLRTVMSKRTFQCE